jgi:dihydrofolate synthase / folylpolyglutamate synthase
MSRYTASDTDIAGQLSYLEELTGRGIRADLSSTRTALSLLGHPERKIRTVIVGGTNGKGSTVAMIGSIIRHAEYSVGCYYSPHILDVRERIVFNGRPISPADMACLINRVRGKIAGYVELTYFEFLTVSAYVWFAEKKADLCVMEVGMGGRFDATNVADPLISVITTVALDHTRYLGDTEEAIAIEKVQIVPRDGILVAGKVSGVVTKILQDHAREKNADVILLGRDFKAVRIKGTDAGYANNMRYRGLSVRFDDMYLPLAGRHQIDNAAVALAVVELLGQKGFSIPERAVRQGIASVHLSGRIQRISDVPEVIVDVAHNPAGARVLADYIRALPKKKTAFVVGMMADKDIGGFIKRINGVADLLVLTQPRVERAASIQTLAGVLGSPGRQLHMIQSVGEAVDWARSSVGKEGRVVITGSFYTVQEAMERINVMP